MNGESGVIIKSRKRKVRNPSFSVFFLDEQGRCTGCYCVESYYCEFSSLRSFYLNFEVIFLVTTYICLRCGSVQVQRKYQVVVQYANHC